MELLAFVHNSVNYEDPTPNPDVTLLDSFTLPSSAWLALAGVAVAAATVSTPGNAIAATATYGQGSTGTAVTNIQKALGIQADGAYGGKTQAAVTDFQIRHGLKQVDGTVGKETATALGLNEQYQPVDLGVVDTYSGVGLNVRSGPGIDYRRIDGLADGTVIDTYGEVVTYGYDDYDWQRADSGGWVATNYVDYDYEPTSYHYRHDDGYDYEPVSHDGYYDDGYDYESTSYRHHHDDYDYEEYSYDHGYYDADCYEPVSYHHDDYYQDDYYYSPVSYSDGGGYVDTRSGIGLNIRSGPGLDHYVEDAVPDGTYLPTVDGTVYRDGYAWEELPDGNWVASDYLN